MTDEKTPQPMDDSSNLSLDEILDQYIDDDTDEVVIADTELAQEEAVIEMANELDTPQSPVEEAIELDAPVASEAADEVSEPEIPLEVSSEDDAPQTTVDEEPSVEESLKEIDWNEIEPEQVSALMAEETEAEERSADEKKSIRKIMWIGFGVACVLALILPAAFVYLRAQQNDVAQENVTVTPVPNSTNATSTAGSTDTTPTAKVAKTKSEKPTYEEVDLEEWNYYQEGFNIFAPARGPRVKDSSGVINAIYKATVYDALDIIINKDQGVQVTIPAFSDDPVGVSSVSSNANNSSGDSIITDLVAGEGTTTMSVILDAIGVDNNKRISLWKVDGETIQVAQNETIGSTGWTVVSIGTQSVAIQNGSKTLTLRVGGTAQ